MDLSILRPEEKVRQNFLKFLIEVGIPESHLVIEKSLSELPHLQSYPNLPNRRVDILAYKNQIDRLVPLLLVECKADTFDENAFMQVLGYNHYTCARYIALVSAQGYVLFDTHKQLWMQSLTSYDQLVL